MSFTLITTKILFFMKLPDHLFWDTDLDTLDFTKNVRFIIQRVIQKGTIEDWSVIKKYYGITKYLYKKF